MNNDETKEFCLALLKAESKDDLIQILRSKGFWDDPSLWRLYGDKEGNYSTAGGQQSSPDAALVEKIINSVDATLTKECLLNRIHPESEKAPKNINRAVAEFFEDGNDNLGSGNIQEWAPSKLKQEARNITLAATGSKQCTNLTICDFGEGQTPNKIPETILSINSKNKLSIPFVQGKFNMGGTGVLRHCVDGLQLVISKRNQDIVKLWNEDRLDDSVLEWGFTIVRREEPTGKSGEVLNSEFKYLAPLKNGSMGGVLRFEANSLIAMPEDNDAYVREMKYGTVIKVFKYDLSAGSSNILRKSGLLYRLETLLPRIALPIRLYECRKHFSGKKGSFETSLNGLSIRLEDGKVDNLEVEPWDVPFGVNYKGLNISFKAKFYVFKRGKSSTYLNNEGIIFYINGQSHGHIPKAIYGRKKIGLNKIGKDLLVLVDCSEISIIAREDLFMTSRDRLSNGELRKSTEKQLEEILSHEPTLKKLQDERRQKDQEEKLSDERPLEDVLNTIIKTSPSLTSLFLKGQRLNTTSKKSVNNDKSGGEDNENNNGGNVLGESHYIGKKHPDYFNFEKKPNENRYERSGEQGRSITVKFLTNVENGYFTRDVNKGDYSLKTNIDGLEYSHSLNLHNGLATWLIRIPDDIDVDTIIEFECKIDDDVILEPFIKTLIIKILPKNERKTDRKTIKIRGGSGDGDNPTDKDKGLALPRIIRVTEGNNHWNEYGFNHTTACHVEANKIEDTDDDYSYDFFINMDNVSLQNEIKNVENPKLQQAKYVYGNVLLSLAIINEFNSNKNDDNDDEEKNNIYELQSRLSSVTKAFAPFLIPTIDSLGNLTDEEVSSLSMLGDDE